MSTQLEVSTLIQLSKKQRKRLILEQAKLVNTDHITDSEKTTENSLKKIYQISTVLNPILKPYIEYKIQKFNEGNLSTGSNKQTENIKKRIEEIKIEFVSWLESMTNKDEVVIPTQQTLFTASAEDLPDEAMEEVIENVIDATNLFTLFETKLLAISNSVTRKLSVKMGNFLEEAATFSPYAISTEQEFGIKIPGIDIIILADGEVEFIQLKTKKDTLTGSQVPRVKKELSLHQKSSFVAAFDAGKWNFSSDEIPSYAGEEFWKRIHIDYQTMEYHLREAFREIEEAYLKLVRQNFLT